MRLMMINPDYGLTAQQLELREKRLQQAVSRDTSITMRCISQAKVCIDSLTDVAVAAPHIVSMAMAAQQEGFDAVGIYCLSDPGYDACRESLSIPVLGGGHCAFAMAAILGYSFSLITTSSRRIPQKREFIRSCGVDYQRLASVREISYDIAAHRNDTDRSDTIRRLVDAARLCVEKDGADSVILGCLSFAGMRQEVAQQAGVPIVDPAFTLAAMNEAAVRLHLCHSKTAYPAPPAGKREWAAGSLTL